MLQSKPITIKVAGQHYCPVCDLIAVNNEDEICEDCKKEGWKWDECDTDRGTQYILTN